MHCSFNHESAVMCSQPSNLWRHCRGCVGAVAGGLLATVLCSRLAAVSTLPPSTARAASGQRCRGAAGGALTAVQVGSVSERRPGGRSPVSRRRIVPPPSSRVCAPPRDAGCSERPVAVNLQQWTPSRPICGGAGAVAGGGSARIGCCHVQCGR